MDEDGKGFRLREQVASAVGAERLCAMMTTALESVVSALELTPAQLVSELEVLPDEERQRILVQLNETVATYPPRSLHPPTV